MATGTPSRWPSSRPRSAARPHGSPVTGSVAVSRKLLILRAIRSVPVGARATRASDVLSVMAVSCEVDVAAWRTGRGCEKETCLLLALYPQRVEGYGITLALPGHWRSIDATDIAHASLLPSVRAGRGCGG